MLNQERFEEYKEYYIYIRPSGRKDEIENIEYWEYSITPVSEGRDSRKWVNKNFGGYADALQSAKSEVDDIYIKKLLE